jgi:hypothetical protein
VDRPLGFAFGEAHNPNLQRTILLAASFRFQFPIR